MKVPDSGMPDEAYWNSLFDVESIVGWLRPDAFPDPVVEVGCGYGTFTVPVARRAGGLVHAFDIEPAMLDAARGNAGRAGAANIRFHLRDVVAEGTGLDPGCAGLVLLFNILHFPGKRALLREAARILKPSGTVAIIHWRKDIPTPRGPDCAVRPDPEQIRTAVEDLDLTSDGGSRILAPWHWGLKLMKGNPR